MILKSVSGSSLSPVWILFVAMHKASYQNANKIITPKALTIYKQSVSIKLANGGEISEGTIAFAPAGRNERVLAKHSKTKRADHEPTYPRHSVELDKPAERHIKAASSPQAEEVNAMEKTVTVKMDLSELESALDRLQEKADRLKSTLAEVKISAGKLENEARI